MNTRQFLISCWTWNPAVLLLCAAAFILYWTAYGFTRRGWWFAAAVFTVLIALVSPVESLANGYLFSAHMLQHILLLLLAPAFLILSLPRNVTLPRVFRTLANPLTGWLAGVGSMWLWHIPALCDAAATRGPIFAIQTVSLLALGSAFWWQVIAPRDGDRLPALYAVLYLFSACVACSVLGMILTFSPNIVCSAYARPADRLGMLGTIRSGWGMTSDKDQQIGGLLMWVPMCMIYLTAIFWQIARFFHPHQEPAHATGGMHR